MREYDALIKTALKEDIGPGDVTTEVFIPRGRRFEGTMFAKAPGVLCGGAAAKRVFELADPGSRARVLLKDGARLKKGSVILTVRGSRRLLTAERTALNFVQHMSGIATRAARFAKEIKNRRTRIYDTRKTIPGLRELAKYAVKCGGGANHRQGLYDAFLIKDNHLAMLKSDIAKLGEKLAYARKRRPWLRIEIEAQDLRQVRAFLPLGFDVIMLDNMSRPDMKKAIALIRAHSAKTEIEISGGVRFEDLAGLSKLGADRISVGSITNSAGALDIAFDIKAIGER
ncbi:MAG: nicotinate-nucleotide diphosphorylase (carboxylating) [Elusimicrobia bacterium RIFOXYB2_FULL_62_6]|nr:MAG: nicotinate-nucleotide diphosphorylase (carboxylating) [Elusimicrobia bacterium RIFOXYB2_FULL_62_6]